MSSVILVPVDFSDCSVEVVRHAGRIAQATGAELLLLHVVELPPTLAPGSLVQPTPDGDPVRAIDYVTGEVERRLPIYRQLDELAGVTLETRVARGIPADEIVAEADRSDVAQIIMGTHGRRGFARMMTGSVAETVSRQTSRPVTLIHSQHKPVCDALTCAWCNSGALEAQQRLWDDLDR